MSNTLRWRKSSHSADTNCIEVATLPGGAIELRNSHRPTEVVSASRAEVAAFLEGAKAGEFDDLV